MAEKGLGMGLGALFGDAAKDDVRNDFDYLPISKIEPRREQPRTAFDEAGLAELAESIVEHGVLQAITVRSIADGYYQIIAGERRWRAARMAGLSEIPARIVEADDLRAMELAMIENLQREDLNPIEEALGYRTLMTEFGLTQEELGRRVSKSRPVIANALRLLTLPESVLRLLEGGDLSAGAARALLSLRDEEKIMQAAETVMTQGLSVRATEELVKKLEKQSGPGQPKAKRRSRDIYIADVEQRLSKRLGRKINIKNGGNKGKIEIEYYSSDDFERLCGLLSSLPKGDMGQ